MKAIFATVVVGVAVAAGTGAQRGQPAEWTTDFALEPADLISTGRNPYFILEPGYTLVLKDGTSQLTITVLSGTRTIDNIETRVVEERETRDGQLIEVSRNFFAISKRTNSVFYFGEDVDMYKSGKVVSHEGAWMAGVNGARAGLAMPGLPLLRAKYYQEIAPNVAMDRAEILSQNETLRTPAGEFKKVLKTAETTPLEPGVTELKYYGWGVGLLQDGSMKLVEYGNRPITKNPS
jgi:hypothetical protein